MLKAKLLHITNPILVILFVVQTITISHMLFGLNIISPQIVFIIHKYNGLFFILLITTHVILNWGWIKANIFKR